MNRGDGLMFDLFDKKKVPQSYQPMLESSEVLDFFSRSSLHQQAALLRLISRNLILKNIEDATMGYELQFEVDGAVIIGEPQAD